MTYLSPVLLFIFERIFCIIDGRKVMIFGRLLCGVKSQIWWDAFENPICFIKVEGFREMFVPENPKWISAKKFLQLKKYITKLKFYCILVSHFCFHLSVCNFRSYTNVQGVCRFFFKSSRRSLFFKNALIRISHKVIYD